MYVCMYCESENFRSHNTPNAWLSFVYILYIFSHFDLFIYWQERSKETKCWRCSDFLYSRSAYLHNFSAYNAEFLLAVSQPTVLNFNWLLTSGQARHMASYAMARIISFPQCARESDAAF